MDWSSLDFAPLANSILGLLVVVISTIAVQLGRRSLSDTGKSITPASAVTMSGAAIVSSESVMMLTGEMAANNVATVQLNSILAKILAVQEQNGKLYIQSSEAYSKVAVEVEELRDAIRTLTFEVIRNSNGHP